MQIWLEVENFAKIEHARICINSYTVLVGPNNSGKTFLMQLVQGIYTKLASLIDEETVNQLLKDGQAGYFKCCLTASNIDILNRGINANLHKRKTEIIKEIFGKEIPIEKIYMQIALEENETYTFEILSVAEENRTSDMEAILQKAPFNVFSKIIQKDVEKGQISILYRGKQYKKMDDLITMHLSLSQHIPDAFTGMMADLIDCGSLFLPASRTGIMLLYKDFFANRTDRDMLLSFGREGKVEQTEKQSDLTKPVYEFLRFLLMYLEDEDKKEQYKEELQFFEEHVIEGHINAEKHGILSYTSKAQKDSRIPMYLASSMINEVAPIILAITSKHYFKRLIIDEVEASLHPQKQLELVRFFNRLNNKGMQLMISTHSDTFVSKLNNLYILSERVKANGEDILKKFNLEKADLIDTTNLFVFEFRNLENGKSVVNEIKPDKKMGYQFDLFTESAMQLYDEAVKIGEYSK